MVITILALGLLAQVTPDTTAPLAPLSTFLEEQRLQTLPWEVLALFEVTPETRVAAKDVERETWVQGEMLRVPLPVRGTLLALETQADWWAIQRDAMPSDKPLVEKPEIMALMQDILAMMEIEREVASEDVELVAAGKGVEVWNDYYRYVPKVRFENYSLATGWHLVLDARTREVLAYMAPWPTWPENLVVNVAPKEAVKKALAHMKKEGWTAPYAASEPELDCLCPNNYIALWRARAQVQEQEQEPSPFEQSPDFHYVWRMKIAEPPTAFHGVRSWANKTFDTNFDAGHAGDAFELLVDCESGEVIGGRNAYD